MPIAEDSVIYTRDKEMRETKHSRFKNIRADATKMYGQPKNARGLLAGLTQTFLSSTPFAPSLRASRTGRQTRLQRLEARASARAR